MRSIALPIAPPSSRPVASQSAPPVAVAQRRTRSEPPARRHQRRRPATAVRRRSRRRCPRFESGAKLTPRKHVHALARSVSSANAQPLGPLVEQRSRPSEHRGAVDANVASDPHASDSSRAWPRRLRSTPSKRSSCRARSRRARSATLRLARRRSVFAKSLRTAAFAASVRRRRVHAHDQACRPRSRVDPLARRARRDAHSESAVAAGIAQPLARPSAIDLTADQADDDRPPTSRSAKSATIGLMSIMSERRNEAAEELRDTDR